MQVRKQDVQSQIPPGLTWVKASLWFEAGGVAVAHQADGQRGDDLQDGGGGVAAVRHLPQNVQQLLRLEGTWGTTWHTVLTKGLISDTVGSIPYKRYDIRYGRLYALQKV